MARTKVSDWIIRFYISFVGVEKCRLSLEHVTVKFNTNLLANIIFEIVF